MEKFFGTIFDIRRFAIHDGEGIRTKVFFKGCPLVCAWCHNPEGISTKRRPLYFEEKCIRCCSCVTESENGGMIFNGKKIVLNYDRKEEWDNIMQICPTGAIVWDSREFEISELFEEVIRDEPFFKHGGGVTLSGGEPLLQADFVAEFLKRLRSREIHTAIETALLVPIENLQKVLPHLNLVFADCKIFDEEKHIAATKVSNKKILENIKFLLTDENREKIIIRTPIISEFTANDENIAAISKFIGRIYPEVRYEILNYKPLASAKYQPFFKENPPKFTRKQMEHFAEIAIKNGTKNILIGE